MPAAASGGDDVMSEQSPERGHARQRPARRPGSGRSPEPRPRSPPIGQCPPPSPALRHRGVMLPHLHAAHLHAAHLHATHLHMARWPRAHWLARTEGRASAADPRPSAYDSFAYTSFAYHTRTGLSVICIPEPPTERAPMSLICMKLICIQFITVSNTLLIASHLHITNLICIHQHLDRFKLLIYISSLTNNGIKAAHLHK